MAPLRSTKDVKCPEQGTATAAPPLGRGANWAQFKVAIAGVIVVMSTGMQFSWSSPALPKIETGELGFKLSIDDQSWIVSILNLSAIPGAFISGALVDRIGRKLCVVLANIPFIIFWVLVYFANAPIYLYLARLVAGIGLGMSLNVVPMYLGEIASPNMRGALSALTMFMINMGVLFEYAVGPMVSYKELAIASISIPILCLLLFFTLPESPFYLVTKGDIHGAKETVMRLRNATSIDQVEAEVAEIELTVEEQRKGKLPLRELIVMPGNRRALTMVLTLAFLQQCTSIGPILAYFQTLFEDSGTTLPLNGAYMIIAVLQTVSCVGSSLFVDRLGRRPMFLVSCGVQFIVQAGLGAFFFAKEYEKMDVSSVSILPLILVMIVIVAYNAGQGPLVYVLMGESLSQQVKAFGASGAAVLIAFGAFGITKIYPILTDGVGTWASFWMFSAFSLFTVIYVYCVVPETKGKTMAEIQTDFNSLPQEKQ